MSKYIIRRALESIPVIIGVSILVFMLLRLIPGDPAIAILGERATPENIAAIRERLGLNKPLPEQYIIWIGHLLQGDLGNTVRGNIPIANELRSRFPATIELSLVAITLATVIGVPMGIFSAVRRNSPVDTATMFGALLGVSVPIFVLGLLLIYLFGVQLKLLPFIGRIDSGIKLETRTGLFVIDSILTGNWEALQNTLSHLILPAITLFTVPLAIIARITRSSMLEVLNQDYIRTARAKGLGERPVIFSHALRNALLPIVTIIGLQLGTLLSGAVLTETIYSWPGIGKWLFDSIIARDYPIVQSVTLIVSLIYVIINFTVDILYALVDPRIRVA
ncbi:MAG: ABC transporter permease [Chloroflexi bacterium]|nr:ABC transporter permease [Chloroflexota bacterium]MDL1883225.1 ABC transporter permease [Anaerolineae bacterium CFX8]